MMMLLVAGEEMYLSPGELPAQTEVTGSHNTFFNFIKQENGRIDYTCKAVHLPYPAGNVTDVEKCRKTGRANIFVEYR